MSKEPKLSARAQALLGKIEAGQTLCARTDQRQDVMDKGGLSFWLEPSGKGVGPGTGRELVGAGLLAPQPDGLLADAPQSWRAA